MYSSTVATHYITIYVDTVHIQSISSKIQDILTILDLPFHYRLQITTVKLELFALEDAQMYVPILYAILTVYLLMDLDTFTIVFDLSEHSIWKLLQSFS